ncbi:MAG: long-chain fatty acid--CoA ligase [Chloroflexi bacterium]|nr:long-chain fatty acid--CoA ligase [Chloroflexota bacterium]
MYPLLVKSILERPLRLFARKEIVSRDFSGDFRYTYGDFYKRVCRLANVLEGMGIKRGDRVATFAWNNHRHLELYFAAPCMGAVLHPLNLRLFPDHLAYIINHAEDKVIFIDEDMLPSIEAVKDKIKTVSNFVVMTDKQRMPGTTLSPVASYEQLLSQASPEYRFPADLDENSAAALCYTSATTGMPKGCIYTHRGVHLHALTVGLPDVTGLSEKDTVMYAVPMFHALAWVMPYVATWVGAKQVMAGPHPDVRDWCQLIQNEKVTFSLAVPTVWRGILNLLETEKHDLSSLRLVLNGGSAPSLALIEAYEKLGIHYVHGFGLTESSPFLAVNMLKSYMEDWSEQQKYAHMLKQGLIVRGIEWKVVDENGQEVKRDGKEMGELCVRSPWAITEYFKEPERSAEAIKGGWLHTGDVVTVDEEGYIEIKDRRKDIIKSGGEWISSIDLENTIMNNPAVLEACVVGVPHPRWEERPVAYVVLKPSSKDKVTREDILNFLRDKVVKWWIPEDVRFVDEIPKTGVGKFNKKLLRQMYSAK